MKTLSTGQPSTLGNWHALCLQYFGEASRATRFIKGKMDAQGPDMEVLADEGQLLQVLVRMVYNEDSQDSQGLTAFLAEREAQDP